MALPPDQKRDLYTLVMVVVLIGIVLIVTVLLLFRAWRRSVLRAQRKEKQEMMPDIWRAGAERMKAEADGGDDGLDNDGGGGGGGDADNDD